MNGIQRNIIKTSKIVAIVLKIGIILILMGAGILLLGMAILALAKGGLSQSLQQFLTVSAKGTSATDIVVDNLIMVFGFGIIELIFGLMVFVTLHKIFHAISLDYTPFRSENAKQMKKVVALIIIWGLVSSVTNFLADKLLQPQADFGIDLMWFVMAVTIY